LWLNGLRGLRGKIGINGRQHHVQTSAHSPPEALAPHRSDPIAGA
jgi:hypothetical protein